MAISIPELIFGAVVGLFAGYATLLVLGILRLAILRGQSPLTVIRQALFEISEAWKESGRMEEEECKHSR